MHTMQRFDLEDFFLKSMVFIVMIALPAIVPMINYMTGSGSGNLMAAGMLWSGMASFYWLGGLTDGFNNTVKQWQFNTVGTVLSLLIIAQVILHFLG